MDLTILKKKISTFRTETGKLTRVSDELLMEILLAWESWSGPAGGFYSAIGVDHRKMAKLLGKAKKLKREGHFPVEEFKEIKVSDACSFNSPCQRRATRIRSDRDVSPLALFCPRILLV